MATQTLKLVLTKEWFDKILSGEKKEEYRELKDYWYKRLQYYYDNVEFQHCYQKDARRMLVEIKKVHIDKPKLEYSNREWVNKGTCFVIELGRITKWPYEFRADAHQLNKWHKKALQRRAATE